ncbi:hypothetical protein [Rhizobium leguminosarum]|nr:hypothetical protein [Rhizobium leguminosarum]
MSPSSARRTMQLLKHSCCVEDYEAWQPTQVETGAVTIKWGVDC